jgi:7-cyano-7-deazaguanine reductase
MAPWNALLYILSVSSYQGLLVSTEDREYGKRMIEEAELEPIPFEFQQPPTLIYFTCPEGTSLCPRSGFPDFWTAHLWYVPEKTIVELKSLKLYLNKFRDKAHYHEELAHLIMRDMTAKLKPQYFKIVLDYTRRGNIQTDVQLEYAQEGYSGPRAPEWKVRYDLR